MSFDGQRDERLELYESFKQALANHDDETFYNADDLVIIIDQAVDLDDSVVLIEALMRAYKFYPDNDELNTRRALMYYDYGHDAGMTRLMDFKHPHTPLWQLMELYRLPADAPETDVIAAANALMEAFSTFDDETIIRLVDFMASKGLLDWLKENEQALRSRCDYLPTLLYELQQAAHSDCDNAYAAKLLEELTDIDPFNADYWAALAMEQTLMEQNAEAITSADYALAIDADSTTAIRAKALALCSEERYTEAIGLLTPTLYPPTEEGKSNVDILCGIYNSLAMNNKTAELLLDYVRKFPDDWDIFSMFLTRVNPLGKECNARLAINIFLNTSIDGKTDQYEKWYDLAKYAFNSSKPLFTFYMLLPFYNQGLLWNDIRSLFYSSAYNSGHYEECAIMLTKALSTYPDQDEIDSELVMGGCLSMARRQQLDQLADALKAIEEISPIDIPSSAYTFSRRAAEVGLDLFLKLMRDVANGKEPVTKELLSYFEP